MNAAISYLRFHLIFTSCVLFNSFSIRSLIWLVSSCSILFIISHYVSFNFFSSSLLFLSSFPRFPLVVSFKFVPQLSCFIPFSSLSFPSHSFIQLFSSCNVLFCSPCCCLSLGLPFSFPLTVIFYSSRHYFPQGLCYGIHVSGLALERLVR